MDDVYFRDLINHAMRAGAQDACVDEVRTIIDEDRIEGGRVSQERTITSKAVLYVKMSRALTRLSLSEEAPLSLETAKSRVEDAVKAARLVEAWSQFPGCDVVPELDEDDTYRYIDPFDEDPEAPKKRQKAFEAFMDSTTTERAPILLKEHARMRSVSGDVTLLAKQVIERRTQRRITASDAVTASSGSTRLERRISWNRGANASTLLLPDYVQTGYGIEPDTPESGYIQDSSELAQGYALSCRASRHFDRSVKAFILGAWASCVVLHETVHQSPYYLGQTEAIAIDRDRGILQCSGPKTNCSAYAIHPTTPEPHSLEMVLAQSVEDALYVDAPTFIVRHADTSIDVTFSIVRSIHEHAWHEAFRPVTLKIVPNNFWKSIKIAFGPLCRISLHCLKGEPTFQAPGLCLGLPPVIV